MTAPAALILNAWLSPAFPTGGFAYSHGLEWAVSIGDVADRATFEQWLSGVLRFGAGRSDVILLARAYDAQAAADAEALADLAALAAALSPSAERRIETLDQGAAFLRAAREGWSVAPDLPETAAYPVAVGACAASVGAPRDEAARLYLLGLVQNLIHAGQRLIPIGQIAGQQTLAALSPFFEAVAAEAATASVEDVGGAAFAADIASMRHEAQTVRLFRT